jgi:hypothetical protein
MIVAWSSIIRTGFVPDVAFPVPNVSRETASPGSGNVAGANRTLYRLRRLRFRPVTRAMHGRFRPSFWMLPLRARTMVFTWCVFGVDGGFLKAFRRRTSVQCLWLIRVVNTSPLWAFHAAHPTLSSQRDGVTLLRLAPIATAATTSQSMVLILGIPSG